MSAKLDGRLALITPEGIALKLTPAGPALRAYAWLIDLFAWAVLAIVCNLILGLLGKAGAGPRGVAMFVLYWGYPVICEVYFKGRTLGKHLTGLAVVRSDGLPVGWRESALRNLLLVADFMPFCYMSGLLTMLCDRHFRRLGDLMAGTLVVYNEKPATLPSLPDTAPIPLPYPLTIEQQRALIDLAVRAPRIPAERMQELADIAEPLTGCTGPESLARLRGMASGLAR
jgi:uncharacterized RDD family membrane protein YckC